MITETVLRRFQIDKASFRVYPSKADASRAAAIEAAAIIRCTSPKHGRVRMVVGTGSSQDDIVRSLVQIADIDWATIEVFHMDEYVGMPATHPASFRRWLKTHLVDFDRPGHVHYLEGDAPDLAEECQRYGKALNGR